MREFWNPGIAVWSPAWPRLQKEMNHLPNLHQQLVGGWTNPFEKFDRQIGNLPQNRGENKHIWNHQPDKIEATENWCPFIQTLEVYTFREEKIDRSSILNLFFELISRVCGNHVPNINITKKTQVNHHHHHHHHHHLKPIVWRWC